MDARPLGLEVKGRKVNLTIQQKSSRAAITCFNDTLKQVRFKKKSREEVNKKGEDVVYPLKSTEAEDRQEKPYLILPFMTMMAMKFERW